MAKSFSIKVGDIFKTNEGCEGVVVEYINYQKVLIIKLDEHSYRKYVRGSHLKHGRIKNPYKPSVFGVGFYGVGKYLSKIEHNRTRVYVHWHGMLNRCYNAEYHSKHPTYKGCIVCDEWLNFQNFSEWFYSSNHREGWQLDKDITIRGNRSYNQEACSFIPQEVNKLLNVKRNSRGVYPIGVSLHKPLDKFRAQCNNSRGVRTYIGYYETPEEAFYAYKGYKEEVIKEVANKYVDQLEEKVYNALINYEIEIDD